MDNYSGPTDHTDDIRIYPNPDCRFAYTLNNSQPVRCTWISDQPLFFTDYEEALEDEALSAGVMSDDPVFMALEKDILAMRDKTLAYEKISQNFAEPEDTILSQFRADADFIGTCIAHKGLDIDALTQRLGASRLAATFMSFAQSHGIGFTESRQVEGASYDRDAQTILMRADLDEAQQVLLAVRELRRAWQHKNGAGLHPLTFHPDHAILIHRAQTADLVISMIRVAWELQLSGDKGAWTFLENSQMADLARAFAREACVDFRALNSGKAATACFETWFLSERCRRSDRQLIQQMLADYQGYTFNDNPDMSRSICADLMMALGKMPFGQNYLAANLGQTMNDPVFTDVRDRSNANFLWFIKFERSFTEAEQALGLESADDAKKQAETAPVSATIIAFPARVAPAAERKASRKGASPSRSLED
jgi:hypothetical protein